MNDQEFIAEYFADTDSDNEDFLGCYDEEGQNVSENGGGSEEGHVMEEMFPDSDSEPGTLPKDSYHHPWLKQFDETQSGPQNIPDNPTENDIMRLFLTSEVIDLLVIETNR